jgi:tryptophan halogenase
MPEQRSLLGAHNEVLSAKKLTSIVIVGGGTAGWMTAALLSKLMMGAFTIRLIESDEIGTIGVGEATIPGIRTFNGLAGVDELDFMRATQSTFKLGIEFVDWRAPGTSYVHGFGKIGQDLLWLHPHQFWLKFAARGQAKHFDHYALNCVMARLNRFAHPDPRNPASPLADIDYAYHMDATLFARFLRGQAEAHGVQRIEGRILDVDLDGESGFVRSVRLAGDRSVEGDVFVDCSGMRSLLLGEALQVPFESWDKWLLCDRAQAVPCESVSPLTPYTRSTAHGGGWQWRIPLQHRIGNGMVYSSAHLSDQQAAEQLLAGLDGKPQADPRPIRFTPGRRIRSWEKNVVAIGLSSGFLEPLESTSIHLIQTAILRLIALFPGSGVTDADRREYNSQTRFEFEDIRDFIIAHYKVTDREDSEFWRYLKHMEVPESLAERLELFRTSGRFFVHNKAELFREESWVQVLIGQGLQMQYDPMVDIVPDTEALRYLQDIEEVIADVARQLPDHGQFVLAHRRASPAL